MCKKSQGEDYFNVTYHDIVHPLGCCKTRLAVSNRFLCLLIVTYKRKALGKTIFLVDVGEFERGVESDSDLESYETPDS